MTQGSKIRQERVKLFLFCILRAQSQNLCKRLGQKIIRIGEFRNSEHQQPHSSGLEV